jgi:predicted helicase
MKKAEIYYFTLTDEMLREDKLDWFKNTPFQKIEFDKIIPDEKGNWLNLTDNNFESLMPVCDKEVKLNKSQQAIFKLYANGFATGRDEWLVDTSKENLKNKIDYFCKIYNNDDFLNSYLIKHSRNLKRRYENIKKIEFSELLIVDYYYRPFYKCFIYNSTILIDEKGTQDKFFTNSIEQNFTINFTSPSSQKPFMAMVSYKIVDWHLVGAACGTVCLSLYIYDKEGNRHDNITDWALNEFKTYYENLSGFKNLKGLTKLDIFHYVYAVLHNPAYREKYELNLKREFPRIPYYENFELWAEWGKQLMDLHLNYESVKHYPLKRQDLTGFENLSGLKAKFKADKQNGIIQLDDKTSLCEIPSSAWEYKLGNRSALEWILDQHKEKKPKDPTIAEKFNTYRFADYKEQVIDLLMRVCTVSVETVTIINAMKSKTSK